MTAIGLEVDLDLQDEWATGTPLPVDVVDLRQRVIARQLLTVGTPVTFQLDPGEYAVRALLSSGHTLGGEFLRIDPSALGTQPCTLGLGELAPRPWLEASTLLVPQRVTTFGSLDAPEYAQAWLRLWSLHDGQWTIADWPETQLERAAEGARLVLNDLPAEPCVLQLGNPPADCQMVRLPPGPRTAVVVQATPARQPRLVLSVLSPDPAAHALLGYLATGAVDQADVIAETLATPSAPWLRSVALGYHLIRKKAHPATWPAWALDRSVGTADGAVIAGWYLLERMRVGATAPSVTEVRAAFDEAGALGLPVCTEGLRLLAEGLRLLEETAAQGPMRARLDAASRCLAAADTAAPLLTFTGARPDTPARRHEPTTSAGTITLTSLPTVPSNGRRPQETERSQPFPASVLAETVTLLGDVSGWSVSPAWWHDMSNTLDSMTAALRDRELERFLDCLGMLEIYAPRHAPDDTSQLAPAPEAVRDQIDVLLTLLSQLASDASSAAAEPGRAPRNSTDIPQANVTEADTDTAMAYNDTARLLLDARLRQDTALLEECTERMRQLLDQCGSQDPMRSSVLVGLGLALRTRYEWMDDTSALRESAELLQQALFLTPSKQHQFWASRLGNLSATLCDLYLETGNREFLNHALITARAAVGATTRDDPGLPGRIGNLLAVLLAALPVAEDQPMILQEMVYNGRQAWDLTRDTPERRGHWTSNYVLALRELYARTGDASVVDEGISITRTLVDEAQAATAQSLTDETAFRDAQMRDQAAELANLALFLYSRYRRTAAPIDLMEAVQCGREAVGLLDEGHADRVAVEFNLGSALADLYQRTGDRLTLRDAANHQENAMSIAPEGSWRDICQAGLGATLVLLYADTGDMAHLSRAIDVTRSVWDRTSPSHPDAAGRASNLALALMAGFARTGDTGVADGAVELARTAVRDTPRGHPDRAVHLSNLALVLQGLFQITGDEALAEDALQTGRQAVEAATLKDPRRPGYLAILAGALWAKHLRTDRIEPLDEAIDTVREVVGATPAHHPDRPMYLSNLAVLLYRRFGNTHEMEPVAEAVQLARAALASTPESHPDRVSRLSNLSLVLRSAWAQNRHDSELLQEVIELARTAVDLTPGDHGDRGGRLVNLANVLMQAYTLRPQPDILTSALAAYRGAATHPATPLTVRTAAAADGGRLAARHQQWHHAVQDLSVAISLLQRLAGQSSARTDQEHYLGRFRDLATDAAACAVATGALESAVALLEQGRGILLGRDLQSRIEVDGLRTLRPELAQELDDLRREETSSLMEPMGTSSFLPMPKGFGLASAAAAAARRRARDRRWNELAYQVRQLPGFADFMMPTRRDDPLTAASEGPVAIINVSELRSDALILTSQGVRSVALPHAVPTEVSRYAERFLAFEASQDGSALEDVIAREAEITQILHWLWDTVAQPVLAALGITSEPRSARELPRLWWMPIGQMSFLPLHAAGVEKSTDDERRCVLDHVVSSYTPTLSALQYLRARVGQRTLEQQRFDHHPLLAVLVPDSPGAAPLPAVARDAAHLIAERIETPTSRAEVLRALPTHPRVYFACHAFADLEDPSSGYLLLGDGERLTVGELSQLRLEAAQAAVLSVCHSGATDPDLADEAMHITTAFHLAGYAQVVGTLCSVPDNASARVARLLHPAMTVPTDREPPLARDLHTIVSEGRRTWPKYPSLWAPFVHTGV